jgi:DNA polymerase-3 subunit alpha
MKSIPLFKSHYSIGRSILSLEDLEEKRSNYPSSIVEIAKRNKLESVFLVEDTMSGYLEAYKNFENSGINLTFGLRLSICNDSTDKSKDSLDTECKFVILAKNSEGYKKLIKISSYAACDGFYYQPRADFSILAKHWDDKSLQLCVPFYDSFLFKNSMTFSVCFPKFEFTKPVFFIEDNDLPFDYIINKKVKTYCKENEMQSLAVKSIYYENKDDFKAYLTFRCINNRSTLDNPKFDHLCSNEFSFESWKEQQKNAKSKK